MDWVGQAIGTIASELGKLVTVNVLLPVGGVVVAAVLIWRRRLAALLRRLRRKLEATRMRIHFDDVFRRGSEEEIERQYMQSGLQNVRPGNPDSQRLAGLQTVLQYPCQDALDELINILHAEKDKKFKKILIDAMYKIQHDIDSGR